MSSSSMMTELAVLPELSGMGVQVLQEPAPPTLLVDPSTNISSSTMDPAIYFAAKQGDVRYLISKSPTVNLSSSLTPQKNTVLHISVRFLRLEFAEEVLRSDPSLLFQPNSKGDTPLHVAARYGHIETVRLLVSNYREQQRQQQRDLESGGSMKNNNIPNTAEWMRATNSDHNTALHEALMAKSPDIALMLLEEDAGLASCENNAMESPLYLSASLGFHDVVTRILLGSAARLKGLRGRNGQTPLHAVAMFRGRVDILKCKKHGDGEAIATLLCEKMQHEDIMKKDDFGRTALHYSVSTPSPAVTRILLGKAHTLAYLPDKDGRTPLFIAAALNHRLLVNIILEHCPDCGELRDLKDQNVLHFLMANEEHSALLEVMKHPELKGLLNERNSDGNTLLHLEAAAHHIPALDFFLRCKGINLEARNGDGLTALDLFQQWEPLSVEESFSKDKYAARLGVVHDGTRRLGGVEDGRKTSGGGGGGSAGDETRQEIGVDVDDGKTINNFANTLLVVATLFASVTFSAIFQPPGGLKEDGGHKEDGGLKEDDFGSAVLGKEAAFIVFVLSDAIALSTSLLSVFWLVSGMIGNHKRLRRVVELNLNLLTVTLLTTMLAFITAVYSVTETESKALAISVLVIGCSTAIIFKWHFHPRRALMRRRGY